MNDPDIKEVIQNLINGFTRDMADNARIVGSPKEIQLTFPGGRYLKEAMELCYKRGVKDGQKTITKG